MKKRTIIIALSMLVLCAGCSSTQKANTAVSSIKLYTIAAPQKIFLDGEFQNMQQQSFAADAAKGTVDKISVSDKQKVSKGQTLFSYKNDQAIQQYDNLTSQLDILQNTYKRLQQQLKQSTAQAAVALSGVNASTVNESVQAQIDDNLQQQKSIKKQIDSIKDNRYTTVTAPFDGIVSIPSSNGSDINKPILTLTDNRIQIVAKVSERDMAKLQADQEVSISIYGTAQDITGKIRSVGGDTVQDNSQAGALQGASGNVSYYPVYIDIAQNDQYHQGFHVQINLTPKNEVPKIPKAAVFTEGGKSYLWSVSGGKAKKTEVNIEPWNDKYVAIKSGINFGDKIVREPSKSIKEGDSIGGTTSGS